MADAAIAAERYLQTSAFEDVEGVSESHADNIRHQVRSLLNRADTHLVGLFAVVGYTPAVAYLGRGAQVQLIGNGADMRYIATLHLLRQVWALLLGYHRATPRGGAVVEEGSHLLLHRTRKACTVVLGAGCGVHHRDKGVARRLGRQVGHHRGYVVAVGVGDTSLGILCCTGLQADTERRFVGAKVTLTRTFEGGSLHIVSHSGKCCRGAYCGIYQRFRLESFDYIAVTCDVRNKSWSHHTATVGDGVVEGQSLYRSELYGVAIGHIDQRMVAARVLRRERRNDRLSLAKRVEACLAIEVQLTQVVRVALRILLVALPYSLGEVDVRGLHKGGLQVEVALASLLDVV